MESRLTTTETGAPPPQTSKRKFRAAIIGCGRMGFGAPIGTGLTSHYEAYSANEDFEVVALCDSDEATRRRIGAMDLKVYADAEKMFGSEEIDILSICTHAESHARFCLAAAPRVRAIFCEKPIATSLVDAAAMVDECRKHGTILAVNHSRRWNPELRLAQNTVSEMGEVITINAMCNIGLMNTGTHLFDLLRSLFGEILAVHGDTSKDGNDDPGGRGRLTFDNGAVAHVESSWHEYNSFEIFAYGSKAILRWDETTGDGLILYRKPFDPGASAFRLAPTLLSCAQTKPVIAYAIDNLAECLGGGGKVKPACDGTDGYKAVEAVIAWHVSGRLGRTMQLPLEKYDLSVIPRQTSLTKSGRL